MLDLMSGSEDPVIKKYNLYEIKPNTGEIMRKKFTVIIMNKNIFFKHIPEEVGCAFVDRLNWLLVVILVVMVVMVVMAMVVMVVAVMLMVILVVVVSMGMMVAVVRWVEMVVGGSSEWGE